MTKLEALQILAAARTEEVVVTCMGTAVPWGELSNHPLDFASVGSAMGHAADFALGLALAQPERKVVCLNGDGSLLMSLGTLVTMAQTPARNYLLFVMANGTYEVTGNQRVPGAAGVDYSAIARGCGLRQVHEFDRADNFAAALPALLRADGPAVITLHVAPEDLGPPIRGPQNPPYLQHPLTEDAHALRRRLAGG
jgi:thiamine pyrophosphate-dependent acetolactate synthase large subunit-like protein